MSMVVTAMCESYYMNLEFNGARIDRSCDIARVYRRLTMRRAFLAGLEQRPPEAPR
jgi:hypothetical protein